MLTVLSTLCFHSIYFILRVHETIGLEVHSSLERQFVNTVLTQSFQQHLMVFIRKWSLLSDCIELVQFNSVEQKLNIEGK